MPTMQYHRDGSVIVTNDAGDVIVVPAGTQADQDAAIQAHNGPDQPAPLTLDEKVAAMAALLVQKGVVTEKEVSDAVTIDVSTVDIVPLSIKPG